MASERRLQDVQLMTAFVLVMIFLGISEPTALFFLPTVGDKVVSLIKFYFFAIVALMAVIRFYNLKTPDLGLFPVVIKFTMYFIPFYILATWIVQLNITPVIPYFKTGDFIREGIVSFSENIMAFYLLPLLISWGDGQGTAVQGRFFKLGGYEFGYAFPTLNRFKHGIPAVMFIALLHSGTYSALAGTFTQFYGTMLIMTLLFLFMLFIKESIGFGASESMHAGWNLSLTAVKGSVVSNYIVTSAMVFGG